MPPSPSLFGFPQIAVTAFIAFTAAAVFLWFYDGRSRSVSVRESILIALIVGGSVLFWRYAANVPQLNDDPIPPFSPNDVLSPIVTYVSLGVYSAFRPPAQAANWEKVRAWLTLISFVVNVVAI